MQMFDVQSTILGISFVFFFESGDLPEISIQKPLRRNR